MFETAIPTPLMSVPLDRDARLELANRLYREYHTRCFWHSPRDLIITEDLIPMVVNSLRKHGGRRGFILSGQLRPSPPPLSPATGERGRGEGGRAEAPERERECR